MGRREIEVSATSQTRESEQILETSSRRSFITCGRANKKGNDVTDLLVTPASFAADQDPFRLALFVMPKVVEVREKI